MTWLCPQYSRICRYSAGIERTRALVFSKFKNCCSNSTSALPTYSSGSEPQNVCNLLRFSKIAYVSQTTATDQISIYIHSLRTAAVITSSPDKQRFSQAHVVTQSGHILGVTLQHIHVAPSYSKEYTAERIPSHPFLLCC